MQQKVMGGARLLQSNPPDARPNVGRAPTRFSAVEGRRSGTAFFTRAASRQKRRVDSINVDATVLHRIDAVRNLDQLARGRPKGTFIGVPDDEVKKMLSDNFLSPDNVVLEQNSPIVNTGDKLILFDTGMGTAKNFGPTTGRSQKSMKEAGIKPEDIDAVVFSHAHIDHIGGVVDESGKVLFPNAQFYIAQSDLEFWTDESKAGGPMKDFIVHARKNLMPVRDRIVFFKDGQEFLPGVQAIAAPGHTVGHTIFMVTSNGKSFAYLGDLTHHPILLLEKPRMQFSYDTDPAQAAETRVKLLDMIAANKTPVLAYHYAWPGVGHIAKTAEGFHYYPER